MFQTYDGIVNISNRNTKLVSIPARDLSATSAWCNNLSYRCSLEPFTNLWKNRRQGKGMKSNVGIAMDQSAHHFAVTQIARQVNSKFLNF